MLAVVACFSAITLSCVTVASALDMKDNNSVQTPALVATSDEAVPHTEIDGESASANLKAISPSCASLYIDGKFIGATEEIISSMQTPIRFLLITAEITMTKQQPSLQIRWRL